MNYLKSFSDFLFEGKEKDKDQTYDFGCLMLYYDFPQINEIHDAIEDKDVCEDDGKGLETETHTTLLYGLHDKEIKDDQKVLNVAIDKDIPQLKLYNVSLFENDDYDVLKFDVKQHMEDKDGNEDYDQKNDVLFEINKELTDTFPFTTNFPDYHPHSTIAYLKSGKGKKYAEMFDGKSFIVTPKGVVYSKSDGDKVTKKFEEQDKD